jgi:hypothetical protein
MERCAERQSERRNQYLRDGFASTLAIKGSIIAAIVPG